MLNLSRSELLLYVGLAIMTITVILAVVFAIVFIFKGQNLQRKLEQEYGKIQQ